MTNVTSKIKYIYKITPSLSAYKSPPPIASPKSFLSSSFLSGQHFSIQKGVFISSGAFHFRSQLANSQETLEETLNKRVVLALYEALSSRDVDTVQKLLAADLEWWFHGPPSHQFLMRILTGTVPTSDADSFVFVPESVAAFGPTVLVEGCDKLRNINWVHAWTVTDGIITQVREYFNTSLTVTRIGSAAAGKSEIAAAAITHLHCPSVWESSLASQVGKSVPGLVLAI